MHQTRIDVYKRQIIGNPCTGPEADKTFYAQSTYVQPVYGKKDLYIAMFDRWNKTDLGDSRYVWLPISFDNGKVTIPWRKKWDIDEYEDIVSYPYEDVIEISGDGWQAVIDKRGGFLRAYTQGDTVSFRNDSLRGPEMCIRDSHSMARRAFRSRGVNRVP